MIQDFSSIQRFSVLSFIWKHLYLILFLLFTLPIIISSISTAVSTKNISYPVIQLGLSVINSDSQLQNIVNDLKTNPELVLGTNPDSGIYKNFIYFLKISFLIWKILGLIFLISVPFFIFYKIFKSINNSTTAKNVLISVIFSLTFIFIVNLLITIIGLINNTISINLENTDKFLQILQVIFLTIPFHGVINLIIYLISLF